MNPFLWIFFIGTLFYFTVQYSEDLMNWMDTMYCPYCNKRVRFEWVYDDYIWGLQKCKECGYYK